MKQIDREFIGRGDVKGITFTLLKRDGLHSLWRRSDMYYEYVKLVERKAATAKFGDNIVNFEAKEQFPQGEAWSLVGHGSCMSNRKKAELYFKNIVDADK